MVRATPIGVLFLMAVLQPLGFARAADQVSSKPRESAGVQVSIVARFVSLPHAVLREKKLELGEFLTVKKTGEKIHGGFIDDDRVGEIIRATQASETSTVMTLPRKTLRDGEQGSHIVAQQQAYVSGWTEPAAGEKRRPIISTAQSGAFLDVTPQVSADRKYITVAVDARISALIDLKNGLWDKAPQENLKVQLPVMQLAEVNTVISIPDEGTFGVVVDRKDDLKVNRDGVLLLLISPTILGPQKP